MAGMWWEPSASNNGTLILRCDCGSKVHVTITKEPVARKVHIKKSHRKRIVARCRRGHTKRLALGSGG